jgi:hypothetical protein
VLDLGIQIADALDAAHAESHHFPVSLNPGRAS